MRKPDRNNVLDIFIFHLLQNDKIYLQCHSPLMKVLSRTFENFSNTVKNQIRNLYNIEMLQLIKNSLTHVLFQKGLTLLKFQGLFFKQAFLIRYPFSKCLLVNNVCFFSKTYLYEGKKRTKKAVDILPTTMLTANVFCVGVWGEYGWIVIIRCGCSYNYGY